jgi:class 3 adenylate cyclase/predicted ATPase
LVGSTALAERVDPEELRELMQAYRKVCEEVVARYNGQVAQYRGDAMMAYFGWPSAHEDDADRSVRAALDIVHAVKRVKADPPLAVHIGVATGAVVVGAVSRMDDAETQLAVGETPNLAARLQGLAGPDEVVIAPSTRRLIGAAFELSDMGIHSLKGIAQPVQAWRADAMHRPQGRFEAAHEGVPLTPLVGRQKELALLLRRWQQARDGEGQVVLVGGEPGIGKSRLLSVLRQKLAGERAATMSFQCSPYHTNSAFYPSIDFLERAMNFARDEDAESKLNKLEALMVEHYDRPKEDVRFIAAILSIPVEQRYGATQMAPSRFKDETLRALVDLVEGETRKQPCVVLFEDAHWADPTSLEVLDLLIARARNIPLLLVLTHRPEFQNRWAQHNHVSVINLLKLTKAQTGTMVSRIAKDKALPGNLLEQIVGKTDGIPLFVEELTKVMLESKQIEEKEDRYEYMGDMSSITIPVTLRDSLMARLDRDRAIREVAQMGSVIGREFSYELLEAIALKPRADLDHALGRLTDSGLAFRRGTPPDATYVFKHALVQDTAYDSLLKSRRQELHAMIAKAIEEKLPQVKETNPEILAHHLTEAGQIEAALPHWKKAGELTIQRLAFAEAMSHLRKGIELIPRVPPGRPRDAYELDLRSLLGTATLAIKGWAAQDVTRILEPALPLALSLGRNKALLPIIWGLFWNVMSPGRAAESIKWAREMVRIAEVTSDSDLVITAQVLMSATYYWTGEYVSCLKHRDEVEKLYDPVKHYHLAGILNEDPKTLVGSYAATVTWILGYPDRAAQLCEETNAHARLRGHPFDQGFALTEGGEVYLLRGEPDHFKMLAEQCAAIGRENSLPVLWGFMATTYGGLADIESGRFADGIKALKSGISLWEAGDGHLCIPWYKTMMAVGMALAGDIDAALPIVEEAIDQIERPGWEERLYYAEALRVKGWMLAMKGNADAAEACYLTSLEWARKQQARSWELRTATSLARLLQQQRKNSEARALLAPILNWFTEGFDTRDLKAAKAVLEELG